MKKAFILVLTLVLTLMSFTGIAQMALAEENVKIGVSIWGVTDNQGALCKKYLDYAAEALGIELVYAIHGSEADAVVNATSNLIESGVQGIIVCNYSDGEMISSVDLCNEAGVYISQFFRTINDPELKEYVDASPAFAGRVYEDEYSTGYRLGKIMADKGVTDVCLISYNHGDAAAEKRYAGYIDAFKETGINLLAEQWEIRTSEDAAAAMNTFMAAYPECNGVVVVGVTESLGGVMSAIEAQGRTGDFVVVSTDFIITLEEDMKAGRVSAMSGGHEMDPTYSLLLCYNAITGGIAKEELPVELIYPMVMVTDVSDVGNYFKYFEGDIPALDADEIRALTKTFNPDFTLEDLQKSVANISVADVMERHAGLFD